MTDRNDPMYVVEKPQLRFAPELILDSFRTYAVDLNHHKVPIYVVHREFLEDESILFRHGMADIFFISNKTVDEDGTIVPVEKVDFPIASIDSLLTGDVVDPTILSCIPTFLDIQFDHYHFRNRLAQHFVDAFAGGSKKRCFRFDLFCSVGHFNLLVMQKNNPHIALHRPNRSHSSGQMLTHDSIFKVLPPCADLTLEFESVDLLFSFLLDKYNFALLRAIKLFQKNNQKDANC